MLVDHSLSHASLLLASRRTLLEGRTPDGHWGGHLSSSALSTATAVTALALFGRAVSEQAAPDRELVQSGLRWLLDHQNGDGGWGDTDRSVSNISTTALGWAALAFADSSDAVPAAERRAEAWLAKAAGGIDPSALSRAIVARYGKDRTFSVPILTMCALAGRFGAGPAAWRLVPQLPFELAIIPRRFFTLVTLPVVSYALPALIAMGLARHVHRPSRNPVTRLVRRASTRRSLAVLLSLQPAHGGFLEAAPLTSFVAMSLAAAGQADHLVARRAIEFLRRSVRPDGSWPIDTNLATWVTTLSVQALDAGGRLGEYLDAVQRDRLRGWLLSQQTREDHPYTGAAPGAWSWTDLDGGVPDADDTPGALLALRALDPNGEARRAAARGIEWLLDLQNQDGGMPTFCRGWGVLPFDRSGADLTAHALRAWLAWRPDLDPPLQRRIDRALEAAVGYLTRAQRADGAFAPLWFGNQHAREEENLTYGTSRVLLALQTVGEYTSRNGCPLTRTARTRVAAHSRRAIQWLLAAQHVDGGWGGASGTPASIEETALATNALAAVSADPAARRAAERGAAWLARATRDGTSFPAAPIGLYFAKLWYYERLYPIVFATEALERLGCGEAIS